MSWEQYHLASVPKLVPANIVIDGLTSAVYERMWAVDYGNIWYQTGGKYAVPKNYGKLMPVGLDTEPLLYITENIQNVCSYYINPDTNLEWSWDELLYSCGIEYFEPWEEREGLKKNNPVLNASWAIDRRDMLNKLHIVRGGIMMTMRDGYGHSPNLQEAFSSALANPYNITSSAIGEEYYREFNQKAILEFDSGQYHCHLSPVVNGGTVFTRLTKDGTMPFAPEGAAIDAKTVFHATDIPQAESYHDLGTIIATSGGTQSVQRGRNVVSGTSFSCFPTEVPEGAYTSNTTSVGFQGASVSVLADYAPIFQFKERRNAEHAD